MTITTDQLLTDIRELTDELVPKRFSDSQILNAAARAVRSAWKDFYLPVYDNTTYTGTNLVADDTIEIAVPAAFYNGAIFRMEYRQYGSSNYAWVPVKPGTFHTDNLYISTTNSAPMIRFQPVYSPSFELRLWGAAPLTFTASLGVTIPGSDYPGYVSWLTMQTLVDLLRGRIITASQDENATAQNFIFSQQDADKLRERYRMPFK